MRSSCPQIFLLISQVSYPLLILFLARPSFHIEKDGILAASGLRYIKLTHSEEEVVSFPAPHINSSKNTLFDSI